MKDLHRPEQDNRGIPPQGDDQLDELTIRARIAGAIDTQLNQLRLMGNVNQLHKTVGLKAETIYDIHEACKKLINVAEKIVEENKVLLNQLTK